MVAGFRLQVILSGPLLRVFREYIKSSTVSGDHGAYSIATRKALVEFLEKRGFKVE